MANTSGHSTVTQVNTQTGLLITSCMSCGTVATYNLKEADSPQAVTRLARDYGTRHATNPSNFPVIR